MTTRPGDSIELQAIAGPPTPPSDVPDDHTQKALSRASKDAKKPLPAERLEIHLRSRITETCEERDRLRSENAELQQQLREALPKSKG